MNSKKAKKLRKVINFDGAHPYDGAAPREYAVDSKGTVKSKSMRGAYQAAKNTIKKVGLA